MHIIQRKLLEEKLLLAFCSLFSPLCLEQGRRSHIRGRQARHTCQVLNYCPSAPNPPFYFGLWRWADSASRARLRQLAPGGALPRGGAGGARGGRTDPPLLFVTYRVAALLPFLRILAPATLLRADGSSSLQPLNLTCIFSLLHNQHHLSISETPEPTSRFPLRCLLLLSGSRAARRIPP